MRTQLAILVILFVVSANSIYLKKTSKTTFNTIQQLRDIKDQTFGKKLLDTIALQIKNSAPLGDIAKLLSDIRLDLVAQKQQALNKHNQQESECEETIKRLNANIAANESARDSAEGEIEILTREIGTLRVQIANFESQISILDSRAKDLDAARIRDREAYQRRQEQGPGVVKALELIVDKLQNLTPTEDGRAVLAQLQKIGKLNPIASLLQISSTFSEEALGKVVNELDRLRQSIQESLKEDGNDEAEAEIEYRTLKTEIANTKQQVQSALREATAALKSKQGALELQNRIRDEAIEQIVESTKQRGNKKEQCEVWRTKFAEDDQQMGKEIVIIKQVEEIIATKLETVSSFVKEEMA